ncbi:MAG TPA: hypothetical protein VF777_02040 [Phycisphaerales bacterium]
MTAFPSRESRDLPQPGTAASLGERVGATLARWSRWEFWPAWMVYGLLLPHFVRLAWRHRSATVFTAANPGMPLGGFVGESKLDILRSLPAEHTIPAEPIEPHADIEQRIECVRRVLDDRGWSFPVVLKPDVGERGKRVFLARTLEDVRGYFATGGERTLVQPYDPGPFEVGVFYMRHPAQAAGRIYSITEKSHPCVVGNGRDSLERLIWSDPRLRLQAGVLLAALGAATRRVPAAGERVQLSIVGNHCRGTLFCDGARLGTAALAAAIDRIATQIPGFCFGRFDIRYANPEAFARGEGFRIVELNGVLSESTNMYDPKHTLREGLSILREQWTEAFALGAANARRGARVASARELVRAWRQARRNG